MSLALLRATCQPSPSTCSDPRENGAPGAPHRQLCSEATHRSYHQQVLETLNQERDLSQRSLQDDQVEAVLSNDFDAKTYTPFHEHYHPYTGKSPTTKARCCLVKGVDRKGDEMTKLLTRRDILNAQKICFIRSVLPTGDLFYQRLLLQKRPASCFDDLKVGRKGRCQHRSRRVPEHTQLRSR